MTKLNKKVLVVDDQFSIRLLLSEVLRSEGIDVEDAKSGEEAIMKFEGFQADLILLDMKMPGMNGVDVLRHFRRKLKSDIPIFMMTAYSDLDMLEEAKRLGVNRQFTKPFDVCEISEAVSKEVCKKKTIVCG